MYENLPLASIAPNPDQPRKLFDTDALAELAGSLRANGLLEPIVVRPHPTGEGWLIIAGERRWRAAQQADLTEVPARIMHVDEVTAFELAIAENVNRHDMTAVEEARAFDRLVDYGRDIDSIATLFGKTTRYVQGRLDLLDLTDECLAQVEAGHIGLSVANMMSKLTAANQQAVLFKLMRGEFKTDNEGVHFAYALYQSQQQDSIFELADEPDLPEREKRTRTKRRVRGLLERAEELSEALGELAGCTPEEFAALGIDAATVAARIDRLGRQAKAALFNARQGAAVAAARNTIKEKTA